MTKLQSPVDVAMEMVRDLEEFERSGGKETFMKQIREEFVLRSGAASLEVPAKKPKFEVTGPVNTDGLAEALAGLPLVDRQRS